MAEETRERISVLSGGTSPKTSTGTTRAAAKTDTKAVEKTSGILGRMFSKAKEAVSTATAAVFGPSKVTAAFNEIANQISNTNKLISLSVKNNREQNDVLKQVAEKIGKGNSFASGLSSLISSIGGLIGAMFSPIKAMISGFVSWFMTSIVRKLAQWFVRRTIWAMGVKLAQFVGRNLWRLVARQIAPWLGRAALLTLTNPVAVAGGLLVGSAAILGTAIYQALTMSEEEKTAILEAANKQAATGRENMGVRRDTGRIGNSGQNAARGQYNLSRASGDLRESGLNEEADFMEGVEKVSAKFGIDKEDLLAVMRAESGLRATAVNPTSGATGLIQFMPDTARNLGTTVEQLRAMTRAEQMTYVEKYFDSVRLPRGASGGRIYTAVFLPGRVNRNVLTDSSEIYYRANIGLDINNDGRITIDELDARVNRYKGVARRETAVPTRAAPVTRSESINAVGEGGTPQPATPVPPAPSRGASLARTSTNLAAADERRTRTNSQSIVIVNNNTEQTTTQMASATVAEILHEDVPLSMRLRSVMSA
jgi:hypothetical protein